MIEVKIPMLAESVAEASLLQWHKKAGDPVKRGDNLIDVETDKVTLEITAPDNGVLIEIIKQNGEEVKSNEVIARINVKATVPEPDEGNHPPSPQQQKLIKTASAEIDQTTHQNNSDQPVKLSPAVRGMLSENNLTASDIKHSKQLDRITKEDVLDHLSAMLNKNTLFDKNDSTQPAEPMPAEQLTDDISQHEGETLPLQNAELEPRPQKRIPMTKIRKSAATRLLAAQHESAVLTTFNEVNLQPVIDLRNTHQEAFEKTHGTKLGFMSFFTKAAVMALKQFPIINARVDGEDIIYHEYFDIGIAISSTRGLVVPVLRNTDALSFAAIESNIKVCAQKANDGKLTLEELSGGTFTITNGGVFGSLLSTPIINPSQSAILGMHKIQQRPVVENGDIVIMPMMYIALSYDHRIIDGREAIQFLVSIKEHIEDPSTLLLQI